MKLKPNEVEMMPEFDSSSARLCTQIVVADSHLQHLSLNIGDVCLFLGVVVGMPGHIAFATPDGRVMWGYGLVFSNNDEQDRRQWQAQLKYEDTDFPQVEIRHDTIHIVLSTNGYKCGGEDTRATPEFIGRNEQLCLSDGITIDDCKKVVHISSTLPILLAKKEYDEMQLALGEAWAKLHLVRLQRKMRLRGDAEKIVVCYSCNSSQPDVQLFCDDSWDIPNVAIEPIMPNVYTLHNGRRYSFEECCVTCPKCLQKLKERHAFVNEGAGI